MTFLQSFYTQYPGQEPLLESVVQISPVLPPEVMTLQRDDGIIFKRSFNCVKKINIDGSMQIFYNKPTMAQVVGFKPDSFTAIFYKDGSVTLKNKTGLVQSWSGYIPAIVEEGNILQWNYFFKEEGDGF